ncbi:hypothetical protein [Frigoribacterium salinisoli]
MSAALERRCRRLLAAYPRSWREQHGEALLGTLLDAAEAEGRDRPGLDVGADLVVRGAAVRVDRVVLRGVRDGIASSALALGVALAATYFVLHAWAPFGQGRDVFRESLHFGPSMNPGVIPCGLWAVALLLTLAGRSGPARSVLLGTVPVALLLPVLGAARPEWDGPSTTNLVVLGVTAVLAAVGSPRRLGRLGVACLGWTAGLVGLYAYADVLTSIGDRVLWARIATPANVGLATVPVVLLAVVLVLLRRSATAVVVLATLVPWLAGASVTVVTGSPDQVSLFVTTTLVAAALGVVALRRLPEEGPRRRSWRAPRAA